MNTPQTENVDEFLVKCHTSNLMINNTDIHIKIVKDSFFNELWNKRNFGIADNIFANNFTTESIALEPSNWVSMHGKGPASMKDHIKWWLEIIPDAEMKVIDIAATGEIVITNWELRGVIQGEIFGVVPTNKKVRILGCTISVFQDRKICLNKTLFDRLGFFQQINLLPGTEKIVKPE